MVFEANLFLPAAVPLSSSERIVALKARSRTNLSALCERSGITLRVTGGVEPIVAFWNRPYHGYTIADNGARCYVVARDTLPQRDPERAARVIEILAYVFFDYAARETVCDRGIFVYPIGPEHGRAWLAKIGRRGGAARTERKSATARRNGRSIVRRG